MEVRFIPAKGTFDVKQINVEELRKTNFKFGLVASVQFVDELQKVKEYLKENKIESVIGGQILGCRVEKALAISKDVDAFLYIGDGLFHPTALHKTGKPIYLYNGKRAEEPQKNKTALLKFLHGSKIGVIVTTKHGQSHMPWADNLREKYKDKEFFIFLCDTLDYKELENFPFIEAWVNTACPRIADDVNVVNYEDIIDLNSEK
jgi:2-(3-amino-3-carboxypropyl)histidine synthase